AKNQNSNSSSISSSAYQQANAQLKEISNRIEQLNSYLLAVSSGELDSVPTQYLAELQTAKNNLQTANKKLESAQANLESKDILVSSQEQQQVVVSLEREAEKAQIAYLRAKTDYETAKESGVINSIPSENLNNTSDDDNYNMPVMSLTDLQRAMEDAEQTMRYANEDVENAKKTFESIKTQELELQNAKDAVTQATTEQEQAESSYQSATSGVNALIQADLNSANSELQSAQSVITAYEMQESQTDGSDITSLQEAVSQQERNLQTLILELAEKKQEDDLSQKVNELELKSQQNAIEQQKEKLEKLKKDTGIQVITSKNDGIISNIACVAGDTVMEGDTLANLSLTNSGYTAQFSITAEQARKLRTGVNAEIMNQYHSDITAKLTAIKPDTENGKSDNRLLIFDITGSDVNTGQSLALSIACSSENYDCVVPTSAIMEDNDGKFVLIMKAKNTPLGNRYYASRCDVTVLAHDEVNSAVQGDVNSSDFVITNSEKPLTAGTQVRMEEN
ncbi:MAG: HlyD family efflux transporter periplasmic adaptor subunit, partial [Oscillospiraceae bacterium]|nr:HlyD family efflux transporter periplasmic adaptor subunit [Oscillospiraceae bacterium]